MLLSSLFRLLSSFFFFNDTATTEIYTLSLHDALPIYTGARVDRAQQGSLRRLARQRQSDGTAVRIDARGEDNTPDRILVGQRIAQRLEEDRKSTRLNSSHT